MSPEPSHLDGQKKKSKKKNPFKRLAGLSSSFRRHSTKPKSKRPSSVTEGHLGDTLYSLSESPGSSRQKFLRDTKSQSLDLGLEGFDPLGQKSSRARSVGSSDHGESGSGETSPVPVNGDLRSSEERRSNSEDPDLVREVQR